MDQDTKNSKPHRMHLMVPHRSFLTAAIRGAGDGIMLGAAPQVLLNIYEKFSNKNAPEILKKLEGKAGIGLVVFGCAVGVAYSISEERNMSIYREELNKQIDAIDERLSANEDSLKVWKDRVKPQKAEHDKGRNG